MNRMNIGPALKYKIKGSIVSIAIFYLIMVLVTAAFIIGAINIRVNVDGNSYSSFSGFGIAAAIFMFITGIVAVREDLRLFMQNGIGRRTAFAAQLMAAAVSAAVLAVMGEILLKISQGFIKDKPNLVISDFYYIIFAEKNISRNLFVQSLESVAVYLAMFICAYMAGVFISMMFYRLNKIWTVVVAVGVPVFIFIGLPIIISRLDISLRRPVEFVLGSPVIYIGFYFIIGLAIAFCSWLLLRRAPVKPATG